MVGRSNEISRENCLRPGHDPWQIQLREFWSETQAEGFGIGACGANHQCQTKGNHEP